MKFPKNVIAGFCLLGSALCTPQLAAGSDEYIYCSVSTTITLDMDDQRVYYSGVFPGDYSIAHRYEFEFRDFIEDQYQYSTIWPAGCFFKKNHQAAVRDLEYEMRKDKRGGIYDKTIATNWGSDKVASIPLQNFNIKVSSSNPQVRVCVRDHECEDGDRILVSVNGSQVFSGEIDNGWDCKDMRVTSGKNRVELYAINGTGNKGACSHADINTGEIRVEGKNSQVQSWRHRGGAGSRASIVVDVE